METRSVLCVLCINTLRSHKVAHLLFSILGTHFNNLSQFFRLYMVTSMEPVRTSFADLDITSGSVHWEKRA